MRKVNISIRKEAYDYLESLKSSDKSISDVILSLKASPLDFFGVLKDKNWKEAEERRGGLQISFKTRIKRSGHPKQKTL